MKEFLYRFRALIAFLIAGGLAFVDFRFFGGTVAACVIHGVRKETYAAVATIFGALLGFEITAFSIVVTVTDSVVMRRLHREGTATEIFDGFMRATAIVGGATAVALVAMFVDSDAHPRVWYEYMTLAASLWATLAIMTTVFLIDAIVRAVVRSHDDDAEKTLPRPDYPDPQGIG
jgi:hypothetical protein